MYIKRAIIFVHYDKDNIIDSYVLRYLSALKPLGYPLIFISTSKLSTNELGKITNIVNAAITRENIGYDFYSYKVGLDELNKHFPGHYSEIVLCNDSVYGPLFPLEEMCSAMEGRAADFWGVTDAHEIAHHIQSYFMVFRRGVLDSKYFNGFWASMQPISDRLEVVRRYEVGLTQLLEKSGFLPDVYISTSDLNAKGYILGIYAKAAKLSHMTLNEFKAKMTKVVAGRSSIHPNPTFILWEDLLVKKRNPFIKVSLLKSNPAGVDIHDYRNILAKNTDYDVDLIVRHLGRMSNMDTNL